MSLDAAWTVGHDVLFTTMGLAAIVTRPAPDDTPLTTQVIWLTPKAETPPFGVDLPRRDPRRVLSVPRSDELPALPRGTVIVCAEREGQTDKTWRVDGYAQPVTPDEMRVLVVEA